MNNQPHPEMVDDEIPELDNAWFSRARPASEVLPEILGAEVAAEFLKHRPGQRGLQKSHLKKSVTIRYSPEVIAYFRAIGPGWQTRMDDALREWIAAHSPLKSP